MGRITVVLPIVLVCAAGCGGSARLSNAELIKRATKICTEQAATISKIPRGPATSLNAAGYLGAVVSVVEKGVKQFHSLRPPVKLEGRYNAFLHELDHNTNVLRSLRAAAAAGDEKDYVIGLAVIHRSRVRIDRLERRLGFTGCAGAGST